MSKFTDFINKGVGAALAVGRVVEWPFRAMFGSPSAEDLAKKQVETTLSQKFFDSKIGKPLSFILRPKYFHQGLEDTIRTKEIDISVKFVGTTVPVLKEKYILDPCNNPVLEGVFPSVRRKFEVTVNNKGYGSVDGLTIKLFTLPSYPDEQSKLPTPDSIVIGDIDTPLSFSPGVNKIQYTCSDDIFLGATGSPLAAKKLSHVFVNMITATGFPKGSGARPSTKTVARNVPNALGGQIGYLRPQVLFALDKYAWPRIEAKSQRVAVAKWVGRFATVAALIIGSFKGIAHWSDQRDLMRRQTGQHGVFMPLKKMPMTIEGIEADQIRERAEMAEKHRKEESSILWRMQHPGQAEKNEAARQRAAEKRAEQADKGRQEDNKKATDLFKQAAPSGTKQGVPSDQGSVNKKSSSSRTVDYGKGPSRNGSDYGGGKVIRTEPNKYNI